MARIDQVKTSGRRSKTYPWIHRLIIIRYNREASKHRRRIEHREGAGRKQVLARFKHGNNFPS